MARWWRRGPGTDPASTHDVSPVGTALNTPVQRAAWRDLPPLRPTVTATTPVAPLDTFTASLATARNPSFLGSLGHVVDPDGPSGMVGGLAAPIVPQQVSAGPELAFPSIGAPSAGIVQRLISPWLRSAPTASPDPAPAPSQTPTPAVAHGAVTDASPEAPMPDADMPRRLPSVDSGIPVRTGSMTLAPETAERATLPVLSAPRHGDRVDDAAVPTVSRSAGPHPTASPPPMNASPVAHSAADPTPQPTAHPTAHPAAHPAASPDPDPTPVLGWSEVVLPSFAPLIGSESSTAAVDPGHGLASADDGRTAAAPKRDRPSGVSTPSTVQRSLGLGAPLSMPPTVSRAADPAPDITSGHRPVPIPATGPTPPPTDQAAAPLAPLLGSADARRGGHTPDDGLAARVSRIVADTTTRPVGLGAPLTLPSSPRVHEPGSAGSRPETAGHASMAPPIQRQLKSPPAGPAGMPMPMPMPAPIPMPTWGMADDGAALVLARSAAAQPAQMQPAQTPPAQMQPAHTQPDDVQRAASPTQVLDVDATGAGGSGADEPELSRSVPVIAPLLGASPDILYSRIAAAAAPGGPSPAPAVQRALSAADTGPAVPLRRTGAGMPAVDRAVQRAVSAGPHPTADHNAVPTATSVGPPAGSSARVTVTQMSLQRMFDPGSAAIASGAAYSDGAGSVIFHPPLSAGSASYGAPPPVQRFGLPTLPSAPSIPSMPSLPSAPSLPNMPSLPIVPALPGTSSIPDASSMISGARSAAEDAGGYLRTAPPGAGNELAAAEDAVGGLAESASSSVGGAIDRATSTAQSAAGGIRDTVGSAASGVTEAAGQAASGVAGLAAGAAGAVAGAAGALPTDLNELARRLFDPLSARLKSELWLDRERAGMVTDLRR